MQQRDSGSAYAKGIPAAINYLMLTQLMYFEDDFLDDPDNLSVFQKIGLLVGLHPDQATERIVRFGLKYSKNFAVLPCCVFPKM